MAPVYRRRPAAYFRGANGVLAATPERLLFVGIEPKTTIAGDDAPPALLTSEFPNDTLLALSPERVYLLTAHGVSVRRLGRRETYAASRGTEHALDSLVAYVGARQRALRGAFAAERSLRAQIDTLLRRPIRYEVRRGDALFTIAARFGTTADRLRTWNHLASDRIRAHDTLIVKPEGLPESMH
jgi:hypothetical protein